MKKFRIASLTEGNKTAKNAAGLRVFVPTEFRDRIKIGIWALIINEHFDKSSEVDENGATILVDKPFDRDAISFIGSYQEVVETLNEDVIFGANDAAIVEAAGKAVSKTYQLAGVSAEDLAGK